MVAQYDPRHRHRDGKHNQRQLTHLQGAVEARAHVARDSCRPYRDFVDKRLKHTDDRHHRCQGKHADDEKHQVLEEEVKQKEHDTHADDKQGDQHR